MMNIIFCSRHANYTDIAENIELGKDLKPNKAGD